MKRDTVLGRRVKINPHILINRIDENQMMKKQYEENVEIGEWGKELK
jgi:hypothetical protein